MFHYQVVCLEFERDRQVRSDDVCKIVRTGEWTGW